MTDLQRIEDKLDMIDERLKIATQRIEDVESHIAKRLSLLSQQLHERADIDIDYCTTMLEALAETLEARDGFEIEA